MRRTVAFAPPAFSAVDPLVQEISWHAWQLTAADPGRVAEHTTQLVTGAFDCLVEAAWRPGRSIIISELDWDPERGLAARLAVAALGEPGASATEVAAIAARADTIVTRPPFAADQIDPAVVVEGLHPAPHQPSALPLHAALIRQRTWTVGDDQDLIEVVSRFNPTIEPWRHAADVLVGWAAPLRVRATVLATELGAGDRLSLGGALASVSALRNRRPDHAETVWDAGRAEATLLDLRASFASPLLACDLTLSSPAPLPEALVRSVAAAYTSESDVLRQQGRVVVAANRLILGGYEIEWDPRGWREAMLHGLPLYGGIRQRTLRDVVSLTESPIGWPVPVRALPTISTRLPSTRRANHGSQQHTEPGSELGRDLAGTPVVLAHHRRTRHIAVTGAWGAGKTTAMARLAFDDLQHDRPFIWIDPHGTSARALTAWALHLGRQPLILDPSSPASKRLQLFERLDPTQSNRRRVEQTIARLGDAIAASLPNPEWTGPRFFAAFRALCELAAARGADLLDVVSWAADPATLTTKLNVDGLSKVSRASLASLAQTNDGRDVLGWVTSKLHPLLNGSVRRIVAPIGSGVDLTTAYLERRPIIANLSGLARNEQGFIGHLLLDAAMSAAFDHGGDDRPFTCFVDEAPLFPVKGLSRVTAEGRKFGLSLVFAAQGLAQLPADFADLALAVDTHIVFRATPNTAERIGAMIDVPPRELLQLPDLQAIVAVRGNDLVATTFTVLPDAPATARVTPPDEDQETHTVAAMASSIQPQRLTDQEPILAAWARRRAHP